MERKARDNNYGAGPIPTNGDKWIMKIFCNIVIIAILLYVAISITTFASIMQVMEYLLPDHHECLGLIEKHKYPLFWLLLSIILGLVTLTEIVYKLTYFIDELGYPHFNDHYESSYSKCAHMVLGSWMGYIFRLGLILLCLCIGLFGPYKDNVDISSILYMCLHCARLMAPFIVLPYMFVATFILRISQAELRSVVYGDAKNIGYGMAWNYFYGYLQLLLPDFKQNLEKNIHREFDIERMRLKSLFIVIPKNGNCKLGFSGAGKTPKVCKARAGQQERSYDVDVYNVKNNLCAMVCPRPIAAMCKMSREHTYGFNESDLRRQIKLFYKTLANILKNEDDCYREEPQYDFDQEKMITVKTPTFQIILCENTSNEELERLIVPAINKVEIASYLSPAKRMANYDDNVRAALGKSPRSARNRIPFVSSMTSFHVRCGIMVIMSLWIAIMHSNNLSHPAVAVFVVTSTVAFTHIFIWHAIILLSEFNSNFDACYESKHHCLRKCFADVIWPFDKSSAAYGWAAVVSLVVPGIAYLFTSVVEYGTLLLMVSIAVLVQHLSKKLVSDVEVIRKAHKYALNVHKGLACSHVTSLRAALPGLTEQMQADPQLRCDSVPKCILSLIPMDAYCPQTIGGSTMFVGEFSVSQIYKGEMKNRVFQAGKYRVRYSDKEQMCLVEYPAVLLTLYDMWRDGQIEKDDLSYHVKLCCAEMKRLLKSDHDTICANKPLIELVPYKPTNPSEDCGKDFKYEEHCNHNSPIHVEGDDHQHCLKCEGNAELVSRILSETIDHLTIHNNQ